MQSILIEKLWAYIVDNNPDLLLSLQQERSVTRYLEEKVSAVTPMADQLLEEGKPSYIIEGLCLQAMTAELKPSRYRYICPVLEDEFPGGVPADERKRNAYL